jgi:PDDEXK-like domain of unknown function (DUF3799)
MVENKLIHNLAFEDYRKLPGISISDLKLMAKSPFKFDYNRKHHKTATPAMLLGSAIHKAILEPDFFVNEYSVYPGTRRGKDWELFLESHKNTEILTESDYITVSRCKNYVRSFPPAIKYLQEGEAEISMLWEDGETGIVCRGRIDWLVCPNIIIDLKTTKDCSSIEFGKDVAKYGYHLQLAYYYDGYKAITGHIPECKIVAVEKIAPYECSVFSIDDDIIEEGRFQYKELLKKLKDCQEKNLFLPAATEEIPLQLPNWAFSSGSDDFEFVEEI